jgi:hypothetical protein
MSSRSLAAARSRRAGENAPPVSGNRPVTSIGSHAAYAQPAPGYQTNIPQSQPNVRVGRTPPSQSYQDVRQSQKQSQTSLPFSKLSISDAIGLITLRLGRVEQWVIETDHENENNEHGNSTESSLPSNSKIIDISVLTSIINRLDTLEKMGMGVSSGATSEQIVSLTDEVSNLNQQVTKMGDEGNKQMLAIAKHSEQLLRFERDLVETKDILKTFMLRYDSFVQESSEKFIDFETALTEVEKGLQISLETIEEADDTGIESANEHLSEGTIESADISFIVKQELTNSSD